ncbi:MAG: hypothetical protein QW076_01590 [Candidatus Anstonellales archaeon]
MGNISKILVLVFSLFLVNLIFPAVSLQIDYPANTSYSTSTWLARINYTVSGIESSDLKSNGGDIFCNYSIDGQPETTLNDCSNVTGLSLGEGSHNVIVKVFNESSVNYPNPEDSKQVYFTLDFTAPSVSITSPASNSYWNVASIPVTFTLSDSGSGLNGICECGHNNTQFSCNTTGTNTVTYQVVGGDGQKTITIKAYDNAGNEGQDSVMINYDTTAPSVSITGPSVNGSWYNNQNLVINFTVNDASPVSCSWQTTTGTPNSGIVLNCANDGSLNQISGVTWSTGLNVITITVTDAAGNSRTEARSFGIDTVVPSISISSPPNGSLHGNSNVAIQFNVNDDLSAINQCWWSNDSGATNTTVSCGSGSGTITGVNWPDGVNNVILYVNDNAGNINRAAVQFTVDTTPPIVTITSPTNNSYIDKSSINITFVANDATSNLVQCKYSINSGIPTSIDCSTGLIQLSGLADGIYVVNVSAEDEAGNIGWTLLVMTIDTYKPSVEITSPSLDNIYFNDPNLVIQFSVSDSNVGNCWYSDNNGPNQSVSCASGQITGVTWTNGWHTVVLYASDLAGNVNSTTRTFYINGSALSQTLNLVEGWNLISFNITHLNASPESVFAPIIDKVRTVRFYYNGTWYDWTPNVGGTITELKPGYAYFVNVTQPTTLTAVGYQETVTSNGGAGTPIYPFQIQVHAGWNLLGVYVNSTISGFPNSMTIGQIVYPFQNGVPVKVMQGTGMPISTPNGYNTQIAIGEGFWFYSSTSGAYWPKV